MLGGGLGRRGVMPATKTDTMRADTYNMLIGAGPQKLLDRRLWLAELQESPVAGFSRETQGGRPHGSPANPKSKGKKGPSTGQSPATGGAGDDSSTQPPRPAGSRGASAAPGGSPPSALAYWGIQFTTDAPEGEGDPSQPQGGGRPPGSPPGEGPPGGDDAPGDQSPESKALADAAEALLDLPIGCAPIPPGTQHPRPGGGGSMPLGAPGDPLLGGSPAGALPPAGRPWPPPSEIAEQFSPPSDDGPGPPVPFSPLAGHRSPRGRPLGAQGGQGPQVGPPARAAGWNPQNRWPADPRAGPNWREQPQDPDYVGEHQAGPPTPPQVISLCCA